MGLKDHPPPHPVDWYAPYFDHNGDSLLNLMAPWSPLLIRALSNR